MLRALPYYVLFILCAFLLIFYLENYQPQTMMSVLMEVDVFGWSKTVQLEQQRLLKIDSLTIVDNGKNVPLPYEEKQALIHRTVFIGASTDMVRLALGEPMKTAETELFSADGRKISQTLYVYYLPNDKRPTFFVFKEDKLADAYKGSVLDVR